MDDYLAEDPSNVIAVHCKAGKGRTGLFIASYLLHCGFCRNANDAIRTFAGELVACCSVSGLLTLEMNPVLCSDIYCIPICFGSF